MAVLRGSNEDALLAIARQKYASIFACDAHFIAASWQTVMAKWSDSSASTLVNSKVFLDVFRHVKEDGRYANYDWTVKVDPDSVFFPDRLRYHLTALRAPKLFPIYIKNSEKKYGFGFLGAIEVFSKEAMDKYFDGDGLGANDEHCFQEIGARSGEDGFMKGCMVMLGAGFFEDIDVLRTPAAKSCSHPNRVCFHAFKETWQWENCYNAAVASR
jgi:hypothetical protein